MNDRYDASTRADDSRTSSSATTSTGSRCTGRSRSAAAGLRTPYGPARSSSRATAAVRPVRAGPGGSRPTGYGPYATDTQRQPATTRTQPRQQPPARRTTPAQQAPTATDRRTGRTRSSRRHRRADPYGQRRQHQQRPARHRAGRLRPAAAGPGRAARAGAAGRGGPGRPRRGAERDYRTEQFSFVEEPDGDSEDVIDWLKFTENRTERREEAKRRGRNRVVALVVVAGAGRRRRRRLPLVRGQAARRSSATAAGHRDGRGGAQKRDVIVVHLHNTTSGGTSTALLVDNTTTKQGTTVLLPNSLAADRRRRHHDHPRQVRRRRRLRPAPARRSTPLLGTDIKGTWRLDTPYLENLVELVGNIEVDTDTDVPDPAQEEGRRRRWSSKGKQPDPQRPGGRRLRHLPRPRRGRRTKQLQRFGQVMQGVLRKMSSRPAGGDHAPCRRWPRSSTPR